MSIFAVEDHFTFAGGATYAPPVCREWLCACHEVTNLCIVNMKLEADAASHWPSHSVPAIGFFRRSCEEPAGPFSSDFSSVCHEGFFLWSFGFLSPVSVNNKEVN